MKQINSVIASILVSGLLVLGMVGIGTNALTNTSSAPANTVSAATQINSFQSRTGRSSRERGTGSTPLRTDNGQTQFTQ